MSGRPMQPHLDARRRLVVANAEHPTIRLNSGPRAPPGDKRARERGVGEIDRHGIVQHTAHTGRRHRPAVGAAILIEPGGHLFMASTKTARRHADPDPHRKAPLRRGDDFAWVAWHLEVLSLFLYRLHASLTQSSPLGPRHGEDMVESCVDAPVSPPMSAR